MRKILFISLFLLYCSNVWAAEERKMVDLAPIIITPWRIEETAANVSKNVTIIEREEIEASSARYVYEVIREKVGVITSEQLGNPKGAIVDIRGFGETSPSNVLVLIDGRRTNQIDLSGVDWGQINIDSIERIEIVRGPGTVLYGDNARGGVINIITKKGTSEKPALNLGVEMGSYGYQKEFFNIGASSEFVDYFINYAHQDTNGYRENNHYFANDCFANATIRPTDELKIEFLTGYHRDHYGMPGALYLTGNPFAVNPQGIEQVGRRGTAFPKDRGETEDYYITAIPKFSLDIASYNFATSILGSFRSRRSKGLNVPEADTWSTPYSEYETVHHIKSYDFQPKFEFGARFFDSEIINNFTLGYDYFYAIDGILSGNRIAGCDETEIVKETWGLYLHDNVRLCDAVLLNAGVRTEWAEYTFDQKKILTDYDTKDLRNTAYEAGLGYKYNDASQVYVNFTKAYRSPNTEEFYQNKYLNTWTGLEEGGLNKELSQQKSHNFEIGIKDGSFKWLTFNADYYWMSTKKEIYYDPSSWQNTNYTPKTIRQGIELETYASFIDGKIRPFFNYIWQQAYFKGGQYANECVPFVPKSKFSTGLTISILDGLDWFTALNYVGSRFKVSDQNNIAPKLKPYLTVDTRLSYSWDDLDVYFSIHNMFDKKYYGYGVTNSAGTAETFYPAAERSFEAGIKCEF